MVSLSHTDHIQQEHFFHIQTVGILQKSIKRQVHVAVSDYNIYILWCHKKKRENGFLLPQDKRIFHLIDFFTL